MTRTTTILKFIEPRPFADPEAAARKLMEIANSTEPVQDGIHIELINWPFLHELRGTPAEYSAGLKLGIERGWLWLHESGTYVKFTDSARPYLPEQRGWPPICLAYCYRPFDPDDVPDLKEEEEEGLEPNGTHSKPDERLGEKIGGEDA